MNRPVPSPIYPAIREQSQFEARFLADLWMWDVAWTTPLGFDRHYHYSVLLEDPSEVQLMRPEAYNVLYRRMNLIDQDEWMVSECYEAAGWVV